MMTLIPRVQGWERVTPRRYNALVERINALSQITGQGGTKVISNPHSGICIRGGGGGSDIHKAYAKAAAGAAATIVCYLDTDTTGAEITVNCSIAGGGNLEDAIPRLADGTLIFVYKDGEDWHCLSTFQASEDCACN